MNGPMRSVFAFTMGCAIVYFIGGLYNLSSINMSLQHIEQSLQKDKE